MTRQPLVPASRALRCRLAATTLAVAALAVPVEAQVPPSRLESIDVYRTAQLDAEEVERRYEPAIRELVAAMSAGDEETEQRIRDEIVQSIRASGDFAFVAVYSTSTFVGGEIVVNATIELVDAADAATRLSFGPEPTGSVTDPDDVLAAWAEYERTSFDLLLSRQIGTTIDVERCPAHHCVFGFEHPALAPYFERFDRAAREHHDALVRVLREDADPGKRGRAAFVLAHVEDAEELVSDLVPSLDDPASVVRNNVMRVLTMVAHRDREVAIPFEPLARRIDDPESDCRNKAASLIAALADRPEYRDDILAIAPAVLRLLRLEKPNIHGPAYQILRTLSGEDFGDRDYERWEAWIERTRTAGVPTSPANR